MTPALMKQAKSVRIAPDTYEIISRMAEKMKVSKEDMITIMVGLALKHLGY